MIYSILLVLFTYFQPINNIPFTNIEQAFNQKNAEYLSKSCHDNLLFSYLGKEKIYSQSQTQMILKEFLNGKENFNFKYSFKSNEQNDNNYCIASFSNKTEKYRITIYLKKINKTYKIFRMVIEKE